MSTDEAFLIRYLTSERATLPKYCVVDAPSARAAVDKFLDNAPKWTIVQDVFPAPLPREEWRG